MHHYTSYSSMGCRSIAIVCLQGARMMHIRARESCMISSSMLSFFPPSHARPSPPRGRRPGPRSSLTTSASMRSGLSIQGHQPTSPAGWAIIVDSLRRADVQLLSPQEVQHALQAGTQCVVDVRLPAEFEAGHVSGTVNVPFFRPISGWDAVRVLRRLAFALFGIRTGTEINPLFVEEVSRVAADSSKGIILMCNIGGVIEHSGKDGRDVQSGVSSLLWNTTMA